MRQRGPVEPGGLGGGHRRRRRRRRRLRLRARGALGSRLGRGARRLRGVEPFPARCSAGWEPRHLACRLWLRRVRPAFRPATVRARSPMTRAIATSETRAAPTRFGPARPARAVVLRVGSSCDDGLYSGVGERGFRPPGRWRRLSALAIRLLLSAAFSVRAGPAGAVTWSPCVHRLPSRQGRIRLWSAGQGNCRGCSCRCQRTGSEGRHG